MLVLDNDLYNYSRPKKFTDMFNTSDFIEAMLGMSKENAPHALLFYGMTGCGKTTAARIFARFINDISDDLTDNDLLTSGYVVEINAADKRKIDDVREIIARISSSFTSYDDSKIVYIFNEVHQFTLDAQKAFLELFDYLHGNVYIIFTTTNPDEIRPELLNRFERYEFYPLGMNDTYLYITYLYKVLNAEPPAKTNPIIKQIYDYSQGIPRNICTLVSKYIKTNSLTTRDKSLLGLQGGGSGQSSDDKINKLMKSFFENEKGSEIMNKFKLLLYDYSTETIRLGMLKYINGEYIFRPSALKYPSIEYKYITLMAKELATFRASDENEYVRKTEFSYIMASLLCIRKDAIDEVIENGNN